MTALLQVRGLVKRFRGLTVSDGIDLDVTSGEVHALIGPNGAGKTTLINLLAGEIAADAGRIVFDGADLTRHSTEQRALGGLVRSYQITSLFLDFTVLQNAMLAVQGASRHSASFWRDAGRDAALIEPARAVLADVGLAGQERLPVAALAHGARRQLELAMVLALQPKLMMLDEPLAGMSGAEADAMVALLSRLKQRVTVLLVEHDMTAVFALADRITVLVAGRPVLTGSPAEVRASAAVREAYLGDEEVA